MKKRYQAVIIGDANVDLVVRLPEYSSSKLGPIPELHGGGTAANVAVGLSRLGITASIIGVVGDDYYGRWVCDDLANEGVDIAGLRIDEDVFTPMVIALIEPTGERSLVVWPSRGGAHLQLNRSDIDPDFLASTEWLHTTGICLRDSPAREAILYAMEQAKIAGSTTSLDLNLRPETWGLDNSTRKTFKQAIELSDVVFGNGDEEILPLTDAKTLTQAMQALSRNTRTIVARQGNRGAQVIAPIKSLHSPAIPSMVIDTLGAGDAFDAGFIAARLNNNNLEEATRWGNTVAAYKIRRNGARSLPTLKELVDMLG